MTRNLMWIGFLGTVLIAVVLGVAVWREPARQEEKAAELLTMAVAEGIEIYAQNCAVCHGAAGEGLGPTPALAGEGLQAMDTTSVFRTIERGRFNTTMAAYGVDEGGILTNAHIDALVAMISFGDWGSVGTRVAELGLTPPEFVSVEISEETLSMVSVLPGGDAISNGLSLYAANCVACHGGNGEGSTLAPSLNSDDLRTRLSDEEIARLTSTGVPGTLMAAWGGVLSEQDIGDLTLLIRRWEELEAEGLQMPDIAVAPIDMSPAVLASGEQLYDVTCARCHGAEGYGTRMAPALNSQAFLGQTPDAAIQQIISLGITGSSMPAWGGYLTEADIAALTAFLRSWEPDAPAIAPSPGGGGMPGGGLGPPWRR